MARIDICWYLSVLKGLKLTCMNESGPVLLMLNVMNLHVFIALEHSNLRVRPISADTAVVKGLN